jgi:hypothetical protein
MAITQAMCTSFKVELLTGTHDFTNSTGNTFKMALYTNAATLDATTTAYTASDEVANGNGYTTAGETLTNVTPTSSSTTAYTDFADVTWTTASFTARGALIYNDTASGDPAVCVLDFGADYTATNGDFTVQFPTANATDAIIRIA